MLKERREMGAATDRFRLLVEAVQDYGIFMLDVDGNVISWNTGAQRIKQYAPDEVIGKHFSLFYPPESIAVGWPQEELCRAKEKGRYEDEGWRVRKDGSRFWANVVITAMVDASGTLTGFGKVTRDLTDRRRNEEALRESEQRFRLLVESVKDYAIYMLSPEGVIQSWNSGAELIKGYSASEVIGKHFRMFYRSQDRQSGAPEEELKLALQAGRVEQEGWRQRRDGSVFWANVILTPIFDDQRHLRGYAKVTRDMTERRQLLELENSSQRMNEFLAMLAHELRNPLAPMRNAVSILQLEQSPSTIVKSGRDMIDRQLSHLTRLVDDLLDVGRLTTGKIHLKTEQLDYAEVVANCMDAVRPLAETRRHRLTVDMPVNQVRVKGDATRLTQALQNLMINAVKFTPEGGDIRLKVWVEGEHLHTAITDTGVGLMPEALNDVFTLFAQVDGAASGQSGLGIGLTLAKSMVELHGGMLYASSAGLGLGSTFTFVLPGAREVAVDGQPTQAAKKLLLVCDDNRDAADSLSEVLRMLGFQVVTVYDGAGAEAAVRAALPSAVFLDLSMPDTTGYALLKKLKEIAGEQPLQAFAVTGYGNEEDRWRTKAAGFFDHLTKPVELDRLRQVLAEAKLASVAPLPSTHRTIFDAAGSSAS
ncbi:MAG: PAS domain S-box protein [Pseudomonadota bacterium]